MKRPLRTFERIVIRMNFEHMKNIEDLRSQRLFKGTGRQTCRSDVPQRGAEMQLSTSTIDRLTDEVFGTGLFVLKCEQGQPRMVPRSIQRKQIKRLPTNPKITRIPNYFVPKKE